jgi:hypothetical protein
MSTNPKQSRKASANPGNHRSELLIAALARGTSVAKAAKEAGYSERQAYRKSRDPEFQAEVTRVRAELLDRAYGRLSCTTGDAVRALHGLLRDDSPAVRLNAAKAVLDYCWKFKESLEMTERLTRIEDYLRRKEANEWQHKGAAG